MNEPEELGGEVHPVATLLPWYVSGTLKEDERQQVVQHLERCQACREELEELTTLRTQLKPVFSELPGSSPQLHQAVMEKIHAQEGRARSGAVRACPRSGWRSTAPMPTAAGFRSARWCPTGRRRAACRSTTTG